MELPYELEHNANARKGKEAPIMEIVGISSTTNTKDIRNTTLYVVKEFEDYYKSTDDSRECIGKKAEAIYVGSYDISDLEIGMEIEIYYDKAVVTAKGTFQTVKKILVL